MYIFVIKWTCENEGDLFMNEKTYQELADILLNLGIDDISSEQIVKLETTWNEYPEVVMSKGSLNKLTLLLTSLGEGIYDFKNASWQPTSKHIFSFDMEAYDIENMYALLFKGIESISEGELVFANILEASNSEIGIGNQIVAFDLNGQPHEFEAKINYDWYDVNIIPFLNRITKNDKHTKQLFFLTDGYQECIVFYKDIKWANVFEEVTGLRLYR